MTALQSFFSRLHGPYGRAGDRHFVAATAFGPLGSISPASQERAWRRAAGSFILRHVFLRHGIIQLFLSGQASFIFSQAFRTMGHFLAC